MAENDRKQNKHVSLDNFEEDPEILRMAAQVSDVLPYVPLNVISANLSKNLTKHNKINSLKLLIFILIIDFYFMYFNEIFLIL